MRRLLIQSLLTRVVSCAPGPAPRVTTQFGVVEGIAEDSTTESFLGVPFAKAPIGPARFRRPEPWTEPLRQTPSVADGVPVFPAKASSEMCTQRSHVIVGEAQGSEDCLYLNIHRPKPSRVGSTGTLPVMVYLFGGAFISGDSHWGTSLFRDVLSMYHGDGLVEEHDVVFVTVNYRVGLLGFLATTQQSVENGGVTGNLGVLDQREALRWIQQNIKAFGGDSERVHLFGQSAGAFSVLFHAVSEISYEERLFSSLGLLSPTTDNSFFFQPKEQAVDMYEKFAVFCGCAEAQMDCLRAISGRELTKHWDEWTARVLAFRGASGNSNVPSWVPKSVTPLLLLAGHGPVIDGHREGLLDVPMRLIEQRKVAGMERIPLVTGVTSDEGSLFTNGLSRLVPDLSFIQTSLALSASLVERVIDWTFSAEQSKKVKDFYQAQRAPLQTHKQKLSRILSDMFFACPTLNLVDAWPSSRKYFYLFDVHVPAVSPLLGVPHGLDIPFVLRKDRIIWFLAGGWYFPQAKRVSQLFTRAFVDVAVKGRTRWPEWDANSHFFAKFTLQHGGTVEEYPNKLDVALPSQQICAFWKHDVGILDWVNIIPAL